MSKKYTVEYFIKKFRAIQCRLWQTGSWRNHYTGACCALGHCGIRSSISATDEAQALRSLFSKHIATLVTKVNDYQSKAFPQKTPRGRILAALRKIKAS